MVPVISIGMPVYNGEATISQAIESILGQTLANFELIISDNFSTDRTEEICRDYAVKDCRVRYIRQKKNIGASPNFKYALNQARTQYFTWVAADDVRSSNFLEVNINFLETNPEFIASTSPNCFISDVDRTDYHINFSITGSEAQRIIKLLNCCWQSHGIFYAVFRTSHLRTYEGFGEYFLGFDWAIDLHIASRGPINRTRNGLIILGEHGASNRSSIWQSSRQKKIELVLPFYQFSRFTLMHIQNLSLAEKTKIFFILLHLNITALKQVIWTEVAIIYNKYIRPILVYLGLKK